MDKRRGIFQGLHQIGRQRILEQGGHRPRRLQLRGGDRDPVAGIADDDAAQPLLQVLQVPGQAEDRHHLRGHGDIETGLHGEAVGRPAYAGDDLAQLPVVDIHHPPPGDPAQVQPELIAPVNIVVHHGGQQVVGGAYGVHVTGEVQVDILHGHHLREPAPGGPALEAEAGPQAGLTQAYRGPGAQAAHGVRQAYRHRGLALSRGRGAHGRYQYQAAVRARVQALQVIELQLRLGVAIGHQLLRGNIQARGYLCDGTDVGGAGDLDIGLHGCGLLAFIFCGHFCAYHRGEQAVTFFTAPPGAA